MATKKIICDEILHLVILFGVLQVDFTNVGLSRQSREVTENILGPNVAYSGGYHNSDIEGWNGGIVNRFKSIDHSRSALIDHLSSLYSRQIQSPPTISTWLLDVEFSNPISQLSAGNNLGGSLVDDLIRGVFPGTNLTKEDMGLIETLWHEDINMNRHPVVAVNSSQAFYPDFSSTNQNQDDFHEVLEGLLHNSTVPVTATLPEHELFQDLSVLLETRDENMMISNQLALDLDNEMEESWSRLQSLMDNSTANQDDERLTESGANAADVVLDNLTLPIFNSTYENVSEMLDQLITEPQDLVADTECPTLELSGATGFAAINFDLLQDDSLVSNFEDCEKEISLKTMMKPLPSFMSYEDVLGDVASVDSAYSQSDEQRTSCSSSASSSGLGGATACLERKVHSRHDSDNESTHSNSSEPYGQGNFLSNNIYHDHTYNSTFSLENTKINSNLCSDRIVSIRDERKALIMGLPFEPIEIVKCSMERLHQMLQMEGLTDEQLKLIKEIRRRGKNKVAAQNCRKRKLDEIDEIDTQVQSLLDQQEVLQRKQQDLVLERDSLQAQFDHFFVQISSSLSTPNQTQALKQAVFGRKSKPYQFYKQKGKKL